MKNKAKILIVEDEAISAIMMTEHFKKSGFSDIESASTGDEAVKMAQGEKPDVIFMDIRLAGAMDGIDTANKILSTHDIPIVFITGYSEDVITDRVKNFKSAMCVYKPLNMNEIDILLDSILLKRQVKTE